MHMAKTIALLIMIFLPTNALAETQKEIVLTTLYTHMNKVLEKAELAIVAAADFLSQTHADSKGVVLEATLQNYVELSDGMRAMLVADSDGNIILDTYNKVAFQVTASPPAVNVSERDYFIEARLIRKVQVSRLVRGKTSGVPFMPMTKAVYLDGRLKYVVIAILSPDRLLHPSIRDGEYSGAAIFDEDGNLYVSFPSDTDIPENFFTSLRVGQILSRQSEVPFNDNVADTVWSQTNKFGLFVVYSEIKPHG